MVLIFGSQLANRRSSRSAIVPYTIFPLENGGWQLYFLLGIHADSGDVTDFGGGVKKYEYDLVGGLREFFEESKGIFKNVITINELSTCVAAYQDNCEKKNFGDGGMSVIFTPVDNKWLKYAPYNFAETKKEGQSYNEISRLVWFNEDQFLSLIDNSNGKYVMWSRLRKFYNSIYNKELYDLLFIRYWWFTPHLKKLTETQYTKMKVKTTVRYTTSSV